VAEKLFKVSLGGVYTHTLWSIRMLSLQEKLNDSELFPATKLKIITPLIEGKDPEAYALKGELVYRLLECDSLNEFRDRMDDLQVKVAFLLDESSLELTALIKFQDALGLNDFCNKQILVNNNLVHLARQTCIPFKAFKYVDSFDNVSASSPFLYLLTEDRTAYDN
jgi:hypothetical protein